MLFWVNLITWLWVGTSLCCDWKLWYGSESLCWNYPIAVDYHHGYYPKADNSSSLKNDQFQNRDIWSDRWSAKRYLALLSPNLLVFFNKPYFCTVILSKFSIQSQIARQILYFHSKHFPSLSIPHIILTSLGQPILVEIIKLYKFSHSCGSFYCSCWESAAPTSDRAVWWSTRLWISTAGYRLLRDLSQSGINLLPRVSVWLSLLFCGDSQRLQM